MTSLELLSRLGFKENCIFCLAIQHLFTDVSGTGINSHLVMCLGNRGSSMIDLMVVQKALHLVVLMNGLHKQAPLVFIHACDVLVVLYLS